MKKILEKIIENGLYLLVFVLPWQTRWIIKEGRINDGYSEYLSYSLYGSDIILIALLSLALLLVFKKKETEKKISPLWLAIGLFELSAFVSIFFAADHMLAAYRYGQLLLGIGLFYLLISHRFKKGKMLIAFALSMTVQAGMAAYQFFSQNSLEGKWLGMARHYSYEAGVSVVEAMGNLGLVERWMRAYGSLPHPNMLGGFLVLATALLCVVFIMRRKESFGREDDEALVMKFRENIAFYFVFLLSAVALFLSFSRSAWLSLAVFFTLAIFISVLKKDLVAQRYLLPTLLYLGLVIFIVSYPFQNLIEARTEHVGRIERISDQERASSTTVAINIIKDKYLSGTGIGNYTLAVSRDYLPGLESYAYQPTHNFFLLVLSELGILGFLALIMILYLLFIQGSPSSLIFRLPLLVSFITLSYFDHWLWSLHFGQLFLWVFLALSYRWTVLDTKTPDVL